MSCDGLGINPNDAFTKTSISMYPSTNTQQQFGAPLQLGPQQQIDQQQQFGQQSQPAGGIIPHLQQVAGNNVNQNCQGTARMNNQMGMDSHMGMNNQMGMNSMGSQMSVNSQMGMNSMGSQMGVTSQMGMSNIQMGGGQMGNNHSQMGNNGHMTMMMPSITNQSMNMMSNIFPKARDPKSGNICPWMIPQDLFSTTSMGSTTKLGSGINDVTPGSGTNLDSGIANNNVGSGIANNNFGSGIVSNTQSSFTFNVQAPAFGGMNINPNMGAQQQVNPDVNFPTPPAIPPPLPPTPLLNFMSSMAVKKDDEGVETGDDSTEVPASGDHSCSARTSPTNTMRESVSNCGFRASTENTTPMNAGVTIAATSHLSSVSMNSLSAFSMNVNAPVFQCNAALQYKK